MSYTATHSLISKNNGIKPYNVSQGKAKLPTRSQLPNKKMDGKEKQF
jgi:hypothetical protein